jgi:CheY-like chemotaxis protein
MVAPGTQPLVLIVDDEEAYRLSVADGLARYAEQFRSITVADGPTALEVIAQENPYLTSVCREWTVSNFC